jgi:hypothetical protein
VSATIRPCTPLPQAAYCQVPPTHPYFWAEVAKRVPGRNAAECFQRIFSGVRSPPDGAAARKRTQAALQQVRRGKRGCVARRERRCTGRGSCAAAPVHTAAVVDLP